MAEFSAILRMVSYLLRRGAPAMPVRERAPCSLVQTCLVPNMGVMGGVCSFHCPGCFPSLICHSRTQTTRPQVGQGRSVDWSAGMSLALGTAVSLDPSLPSELLQDRAAFVDRHAALPRPAIEIG